MGREVIRAKFLAQLFENQQSANARQRNNNQRDDVPHN